jgi:hypothetical protein
MGHCYCEILIIGFPLVDSRNKIGEKGVVVLYTTRVADPPILATCRHAQISMEELLPQF